jgi:peptidoglycan/xylan/chitin deacetylase (PgdA/CDA1 family)
LTASAFPQVSVVVPVHNVEETLEETLASLQAQSTPDWEAIVVDDGSTDSSLSIARSFAETDPRFRIVSRPHGGASAARNAGIAHVASDQLLFLDADDWIAPEYIGTMTAALRADADLDGVVCKWIGVYSDGRWGSVKSYRQSPGLQAKSGCPFAIHACVVKKQAVVEAGGFDETLRTCEDWDLWQRIAQRGGRYGAVSKVLAYQRLRSRSLSSDFSQVYQDAVKVMAAGFARDAEAIRRDAGEQGSNGQRDRDLLASNMYYGLVYWGIGAAAHDLPTSTLWEQLDSRSEFRLGPGIIASSVFHALGYAFRTPPREWPGLWPHARTRVLGFLEELEAATGSPSLVRRVLAAMAHSSLRAQYGHGADLVEGAFAVSLEVFGPIGDIEIPDETVDRLVAGVMLQGTTVGTLGLPVEGGRISADVIKHAVADRFANEIVTEVMSKLPAEIVPRKQGASPSVFADLLVGGGTAGADAAERPRIVDYDGAAPLVVELTGELPEVVVNGGEEIEVVATLGGVGLGRYRIPGSGGRVAAETLGRAIRTAAGPDLVRLCLRQAVIGQEIAGLDEMRQRLRRHGETAAGEQMSPPPTDGLLSSNSIIECLVTEAGRVRSAAAGRGMFESLFARSPDPWKYTNAYECVKYDQTLSLLPPGPIRNALEIACAEGHFTEMLAPRVDKLIAADISQIALERAALRAREFSNVSYMHLDLQTDELGRDFDLIVCSEVLYFLGNKQRLGSAAGKLADALGRGGHLIMAHANLIVDEPDKAGFDWPHQPYGAKTISDVFSAEPQLQLVREVRTPLYRVQAFRKVALGSSPAPEEERVILTEQPTPVPESVTATVRWQGGYPSKSFSDDSGWATSIPILAYHRIAPPQTGPLGRYSVDPDEFARQLAYLRDAGFHALSWDSLRVHLRYGLPVPGRPVLLTFDDGYKDFRELAWPLLQKHGFTATVFVCPAHVGRSNTWDAGAVPLLDWSDIEALAAEGVGFGAHSLTHAPLTALSVTEATAELAASKQALEEHLGAQVTVMAYPYGDCDPLVEHLARAAGYAMCVTTQNRQCRLWDRHTALPRVDVHGDMSFDQFVLAATGAIDKSAGPVQKMCAFLEGLNRPDRALQTARDWAQRCGSQGDYQLHLARVLDRQELRADALDAYRRAVELEPGRADYAVQLSKACAGQGLHEEAIEVAQRAVARVPESPTLLLHLGALLMRERRFAEAESALRNAIGIKPDLARAYEHLVVACERQGRFGEALALAERSAAQFPGSAGLQKRLASLRTRASA